MAYRRSVTTVTRTCDRCSQTFTWTDHGSALTSDLVYLVILDDGQRLNLCNPCHIRARRGEQPDTLVLESGRELTMAAQCAISTRNGNPRVYGKPTRHNRELAAQMLRAEVNRRAIDTTDLTAALVDLAGQAPDLIDIRNTMRRVRQEMGLRNADTDLALNWLKAYRLNQRGQTVAAAEPVPCFGCGVPYLQVEPGRACDACRAMLGLDQPLTPDDMDLIHLFTGENAS